ncbi:universal stress protein [Halalkalicoccus jeotgali]|uniref:universal stress protein n=1 Tax=Halalkalicoccus jeotgali TaxID=413810 RepID=UPI0011D271F3|nr:universal stress protein [Halalkalicoccus jeotgali]
MLFLTTHDIDSIAMGAHSRGRLARFLRESIAEQVAQTASVPVLTVRSEENHHEGNIQWSLVRPPLALYLDDLQQRSRTDRSPVESNTGKVLN